MTIFNLQGKGYTDGYNRLFVTRGSSPNTVFVQIVNEKENKIAGIVLTKRDFLELIDEIAYGDDK